MNLPVNVKAVRALTTLDYAFEGVALQLTTEAGGFELQVNEAHFDACLYAVVTPDTKCIIGAYKTLIELEAATDMLDYYGHRYLVYEVISAETAGH